MKGTLKQLVIARTQREIDSITAEIVRKTEFKNSLSDEDLKAMEAEIAALQQELEAAKQALEEAKSMEEAMTIEQVKALVAEKLGKQLQDFQNSLSVLLDMYGEDKAPKPKKRSLREVMEKEFAGKMELGKPYEFENAFTILPENSLPIEQQGDILLPYAKGSEVEKLFSPLQGGKTGQGGKLKITRIAKTGTAAVVDKLGEKPQISLTATTEDLLPLKIASTIQNIADEDLNDIDFLESMIMDYQATDINDNIETELVKLVDTKSTPFAVTADTLKTTKPNLYNLVVAAIAQIRATGYKGAISVLANDADLLSTYNLQNANGTPTDDNGIKSLAAFGTSPDVPADTLYVFGKENAKIRKFPNLIVEKTISHTHKEDGSRSYTNGKDFIADRRIYATIYDTATTIKIASIATALGLITEASA